MQRDGWLGRASTSTNELPPSTGRGWELLGQPQRNEVVRTRSYDKGERPSGDGINHQNLALISPGAIARRSIEYSEGRKGLKNAEFNPDLLALC